MTHAQRVALRLSIVLLALAGALLATAWHGASGWAPTAQASAGTFYGGDTTWTINAIRSIWPQAAGPYCGIETAEAAVNYNDEVRGVGMRFRSTADQRAVAQNNQASGAIPRRSTPMAARPTSRATSGQTRARSPT